MYSAKETTTNQAFDLFGLVDSLVSDSTVSKRQAMREADKMIERKKHYVRDANAVIFLGQVQNFLRYQTRMSHFQN